MPSAWPTVTWRAPATGPAKVTRPSDAAATIVPGTVAYSRPRLPGPKGVDGRRNGSITGAATGGWYQTLGRAGWAPELGATLVGTLPAAGAGGNSTAVSTATQPARLTARESHRGRGDRRRPAIDEWNPDTGTSEIGADA